MKDQKKASVARAKEINAAKENRLSKGQDSAKVHNTKGKNLHGRTYR